MTTDQRDWRSNFAEALVEVILILAVLAFLVGCLAIKWHHDDLRQQRYEFDKNYQIDKRDVKQEVG